jgi:hypothetical protein
MNENERIKENVQCDVREHLFHRLQSRFNYQWLKLYNTKMNIIVFYFCQQ